jgi:hypothetical protein
MFDRFDRIAVDFGNQPSPSRLTADIQVTEKRAPTDASVQILREMEAAAEQKVLESIIVRNTLFETVVQIIPDNASDKIHYRAIFKLNGKQMRAVHTVDRLDAHDRDACWAGLKDEVAKVIATEILSEAWLGSQRFATER